MKVEQNTDVMTLNNQKPDYHSENAGTPIVKEKKKENIQSVSGVNLTGESLIAQRKGIAIKQAFKVVAEAFSEEKNIDTKLQEIRDKIHEINDELAEIRESAQGNIKGLMGVYGIDPDSDEGKKVLKDAIDRMNGFVAYDPSGKESEFEETPKYSKFQGELDRYLRFEIDKIRDLRKEQMQAVMAGKDIRSARDKSHNMIDSQKAAEDIMEAAVREEIALITDEAVDHIDEEEKEREEEAKEAAEDKKEEKKEEAKKLEKEAMQQEMIANIREHAEIGEKTSADVKKAIARRERTESVQINVGELSEKIVISDDISLEEAQEAVNSEITNILNKFLLTPSDIKGGVVDDQV